MFKPSIQSFKSPYSLSSLKHLGILNNLLSYFFPISYETEFPDFGDIKQIFFDDPDTAQVSKFNPYPIFFKNNTSHHTYLNKVTQNS